LLVTVDGVATEIVNALAVIVPLKVGCVFNV
jgi:hypothetical protein